MQRRRQALQFGCSSGKALGDAMLGNASCASRQQVQGSSKHSDVSEMHCKAVFDLFEEWAIDCWSK